MPRNIYYKIFDSTKYNKFKQEVIEIIKNSDWNNYTKLIYSDDNPDITIKLTENKDITLNNEKYPDGTPIKFSTTTQGKNTKPFIDINADNWIYGVKQSGLTLDEYKIYIINHELGHALGYDHQKCDKKTVENGRCPIMYQSTRGCPPPYKCGYDKITPSDLEKKIGNSYVW